MNIKHILLCILATFCSLSAQTTIVLDTSHPGFVTSNGITGFGSTGNSLIGSEVKITYADGSTDIDVWQSDGAGGGLAESSGNWTLELGSSTNFSNPWIFTNNASGPATASNTITNIEVYVTPANEAFDLTDPSTGTAGSARGRTLQINSQSSSISNFAQTVTYDLPTNIAPDPHVLDFWGRMTIDITNNDSNLFNGIAPGENFGFIQDTDTILPPTQVVVPEASVSLLLSLTFIAVLSIRKR